MALTIICVTGPPFSGKSSIIRAFTSKYLKYTKVRGDVLGIFPMPWLCYPVAVNGSGDDPKGITWAFKFFSRYRGLKVMIVACHGSRSKTFQTVMRFKTRRRATLHLIPTKKLSSRLARNAAIRKNSEKIKDLMPSRGY